MATGGSGIRVRPDVAAAIAAGQPVVALETTLIAHGLPRPDNLDFAFELQALVRAAGAIPATVGLIDGCAIVGLSDVELTRIARAAEVPKVSVRDLSPASAAGGDGATTVASTAYLAHRAGIRLFATGGLGGVHREARDSWDESADLQTLSRTPIGVVCAGVKSILDVGATLERLETLSVSVVGYRTDRFPGFYLADSGFGVDWTVESPAAAAAILGAGLSEGATIFVQAVAADAQLDPDLHERVLHDGLAAARAAGVHGKAITPFLLSYFHTQTHGASLRVNLDLVRANARLAAEIATAL